MKAHLTATCVTLLALLAACTPQRTSSNVQQFQYLAAKTQFEQIKVQLARSIDDPYDLPVLTTFDTSVVKSTAGIAANWTNVNTDSASDGNTHSNTVTFPGLSAGSETQTTVNTTSSPRTIQVLRDLYTYAVIGEKNWGPEVDQFLTPRPPAYPWLFHSAGGKPAACAQYDCVYLGKYGRHHLWAKDQRSYSDFALSVLNGARITGQAVIIAAPGTVVLTQKAGNLPKRRVKAVNVAPPAESDSLSKPKTLIQID